MAFAVLRRRECLTSVRIVCLTSAGRVSQWSMIRCKSEGKAGTCAIPLPSPLPIAIPCYNLRRFRACGSIPVGVILAFFALFALCCTSLQTLEKQVLTAVPVFSVSTPEHSIPAGSCAKFFTFFGCCPAACSKNFSTAFPVACRYRQLQNFG